MQTAINDFTYDSYAHMLSLIQSSEYGFAQYHNHANYDSPCIMRHDIDMDMAADLRLAKLEHKFSKYLSSTYFVLLWG